jgi:hypothetical protein
MIEFNERIASSFYGAVIGYKGTMESLSWGTVLMTFLATPMFYLLFFFFVRLQSIPEDQITLYLLLSILILPTGSCIFYLGTSFHKLKMWGILRYLLISERSLLNIALHKALVTVTLAFAVSCFWLGILEGFFIDSGLSWQQWLVFVFVLLFSCLVFISFGILCATIVLPMKDRLITTNSLFFVVILFSGILFQVDAGWLYWGSHILPITPFVSALKNVVIGSPFAGFLFIALANAGLYLLVSHLILTRTMTKLMQGDGEF